MIKTKAILIMVVLCTMTSVCWGQIYWERTFGDPYYHYPQAITSTQDGNFIVIVGSYSYYSETNNVQFFSEKKVTPQGDTLWTRTDGGIENNHYAHAIAPTQDGNFIVAGEIFYKNYGIYLLKITSNGDTLWTKTFEELREAGASAIIPTPDGNLIIVGYIYSGGIQENVYVLKITSNGDILWTKIYGRSDCNYALGLAITSTPEGNFIIAGVSDGVVYLIKGTSKNSLIFKIMIDKG